MNEFDAAEGRILSVNVSTETGTSKHPVPVVRLYDEGVVGDAHAGSWFRQVSLLGMDSIRRFSAQAGRDFQPGEFAENLTVEGLDFSRIVPLDRLVIGEAELEVTQLGKKCHGDGCAIFREVGRCVMPKEGIFSRVLRGGEVRGGDTIEHRRRVLQGHIITVSDRASRAEYGDRSGPQVVDCLEKYFHGRAWKTQWAREIVPDEADRLGGALRAACEGGAKVVFTTGGTGIGPRDITPEVVLGLADKVIPGVMEQVRQKYGSEHPNALLSRSVAVVVGKTLVYALPGSPKAVEEYMGEILKSLEHALLMVQGLGHG